MAHLTDLNGQPMTWDELLRRNELWHATHQTTVVTVLRNRAHKAKHGCQNCRDGVHGPCSGRRISGGRVKPCECSQKDHAA